MPKLMCEFILCVHNSSNEVRSVGECLCNEEVTLVHKEYDTEDGYKECLDCNSFIWDYNKKLIPKY